MQTTEPAQVVATETIPPTATAPEVAGQAAATVMEQLDKNRQIQTALKSAGFYAGPVDGKIGPKTKKSIEAF